MPTETFSLLQAVQDFVPVLLAAWAFTVLARWTWNQHADAARVVTAGATLITLGGLLKAVWKLTMALSAGAVNIVPFEAAQFPLMTIGFLLLMGGLLTLVHARLGHRTTARGAWGTPLAALAGIGVLAGVLWAVTGDDTGPFILMMLAMMVGVLGVGGLLLALAWGQHQPWAFGLVLAYIACMMLMSSYDRMNLVGAQQWLAQWTNTLGHALLLWAALRLRGGRVARPVVALGAD